MSNFDMNILIENILKLMKDKHITQQQLAEKLGMSQPNISKALSKNDKKCFTLDQVVGISRFFKVSVDQLLGNQQRAAAIATSPRATAAFISELLAHEDAKIIPYEVEEEIFEIDYSWSDGCYPSTKHEARKVVYPAIYLPSYWEVPFKVTSEAEAQARDEAIQCGNDTRMLPVNDFINRFTELHTLYQKKQLSEETYRIVINELLGNLREI